MDFTALKALIARILGFEKLRFKKWGVTQIGFEIHNSRISVKSGAIRYDFYILTILFKYVNIFIRLQERRFN